MLMQRNARMEELQERFSALEPRLPESAEKEAISLLHAMLLEGRRWQQAADGTDNPAVGRMGAAVDYVANLYKTAPAMNGRAENEGLPVGTEAPDFTLPDANDLCVSLSGFRGQNVVLVFYPLDWSPACSDQLSLYQSELEEFRKYNNYLDLVLWAGHARLLTMAEAETLLVMAARRPEEAGRVYAHALELHETLYRVLKAFARGAALQEADLAALNAARSAVLARSRLVLEPTGPAIAWPGGESRLDRMLDPTVLSAVDLLTSSELVKLQECDGDSCDWLFVNRSRNHLRRWCSMDHCGNRAKSRRQYERSKQPGMN